MTLFRENYKKGIKIDGEENDGHWYDAALRVIEKKIMSNLKQRKKPKIESNEKKDEKPTVENEINKWLLFGKDRSTIFVNFTTKYPTVTFFNRRKDHLNLHTLFFIFHKRNL